MSCACVHSLSLHFFTKTKSIKLVSTLIHFEAVFTQICDLEEAVVCREMSYGKLHVSSLLVLIAKGHSLSFKVALFICTTHLKVH